jgi:anti-sigma regulatory factor (Ser/Thr protein kinase)
VTAPGGTRSVGGFVHLAGFYDSDESFVKAFVPFCLEGLERDEPTLVRADPRKFHLLASVIDDADGLVFLESTTQYPNPPSAFATIFDLAERYGASPERPVRVISEIPTPSGLSRDAWARYEAAANRVLADLPLYGLCVYDRRATPLAFQAEIERTHPFLATTTRWIADNPRYEHPEAVIAEPVQTVSDPLESGAPTIELVDPSPAATRAALTAVAFKAGLPASKRDDLLAAVSEVVANALTHGQPPVRVRAWEQRGRVAVLVRDEGEGPRDLFAGLLPLDASERESGLGLWLTHQLCPEIAISRTNGFTVRLAAGAPAQ